jgi:hypothetical protein
MRMLARKTQLTQRQRPLNRIEWNLLLIALLFPVWRIVNALAGQGAAVLTGINPDPILDTPLGWITAVLIAWLPLGFGLVVIGVLHQVVVYGLL